MLGKLLKYEYKATAIMFAPMLIAFLLSATIMRILTSFSTDMLAVSIFLGLTRVIMVLLLIILIVYPVISGAQRFKKNLLGDEGYLMNTLPVKVTELILSKLVVSISWVLTSICSAVLAAVIIFAGQDFTKQITDLVKLVYSSIPNNPFERPWFVVATVISLFLGLTTFILYFYLSLSVGNLANSRRRLVAVLTFIGIYVFTRIVNISFLVGFGGDMESKTDLQVYDFSIISSIILNVIFIGLFYFFTNKILKRKLNLE